MVTRTLEAWETKIARVVSDGTTEDVIVRGLPLSQLIGTTTFAEMVFLLLQGRLPTPPQAQTLDALLVASIEHGIAPPAMIARCFASYGTTMQAAIGAGIAAFGDRMGGLGEHLAELLQRRYSPLLAGGVLSDERLDVLADTIAREEAGANRRLPGFGIPLHGTDPRAVAVLGVARKLGTFGQYCRLGLALEAALARSRGGRTVPMNIDGVCAVVALDLGFDWQTTQVFLITPRTVSSAAHFIEECAQDSTWRHIPNGSIFYDGPDPEHLVDEPVSPPKS